MLKKLIGVFLFLGALLADGQACATNCPSFPYTLANGTTADANQVMANFNNLLTCSNLYLAHSGANTDITSLSGLTTPLPLSEGGTGSTSASAAQTALGLGTSAVVNTGTSGATIPLLNGVNTWAGAQTFSGGLSGVLTGSLTGYLTTGYTIGMTGDVTWTSPTFNVSSNVTAAATLATVNSNVGACGSATTVPTITLDAKGRATACTTSAITASTAATLATGRTISITGDLTYTSPAFDGSTNITAAGTLATVNSNTGSFGSGTSIPNFTVNGKGLITAAGATTITAPASIAGFTNLKETAPGSAQVVTVTADSVVAIDASGNAYRGTSLSCSLSIASSGSVNTLDTGSAAASTWYYDFAIYNGSTWGCLASASSTAPTLPSGYTARARLGSFRTDGSANVKAYVKYGRAQQWVNTGSGLPIMASGSAGSGSTPNAAVATGAFAPPTAASIAVAVYANNSVSAAAPNGSYGALNSSSNAPPVITITQSGDQNSSFARFVLEGSNIYWYSGNTNGALYAVGYDDNL